MVVPLGLGEGGFGFNPGSRARALRSPWVHVVGLCVAVAGAFTIVHRDDLAEHAVAVLHAGDEPAAVPGETAAPIAVADRLPVPAPAPRAAGKTEDQRSLEGDPAPDPASGQGGPLSSDAAPPSVEWQVLYRLGHEFQSKGELDAAAEMFRLAAELNPSHGALLYDWGYLLQTQGEDEAAIEKYRKAIQLDPAHPFAHYNLGYLLQRRGEVEAALDNYQKAGEIHPDNPYLQYNWGVVLEWLGDDEGALRHYRRSVELAPESQPGLDARRRMARLDDTG